MNPPKQAHAEAYVSETRCKQTVWMSQVGDLIVLTEGQPGYYSHFQMEEWWTYFLQKHPHDAVPAVHELLLNSLKYEKLGDL